jgi:uncharacterized RDD family membrane protein YckC
VEIDFLKFEIKPKQQTMDQILDSPVSTQKTLTYAGFWIRVGAYIIDAILLSVVNVALSFMFLSNLGDISTIIIYYCITIGIGVAYMAGMESSERQATFGKLAVGIKVGNETGERISFGNAVGRYFAKIISGLLLCIGFMMVGWDDKKQGMHDKMAGTIVYFG